jgi:hypothetical protein
MNKFIIRRDAQNNITGVISVPSDYVLQNGEQFVSITGIQPDVNESARDSSEAITKARQEERAKLHSQIDREKEERAKLQKDLEELKKQQEALLAQKNEEEKSRLKPDERRDREFKELQEKLLQAQQQGQEQIAQLQAHLRATALTAYRERALREVGNAVIPELVNGASEQEIDRSVQIAHEVYNNLHTSFARQYGINPGQPPQQPTGNNGLSPVAVVPPQSPYYVPQPNEVVQQGFPTPVAPGIQTGPTISQDISDLTSEDAVRSGRYSGEIRAQILSNLKAGGNMPLPIGTNPRFMSQTGYGTQLPNGAMAPPSQPSPQVQRPGYAPPQGPGQASYPGQPVQGAQQPPGAIDRAALEQAIQRTHVGQNPVLSQMDPNDAAKVRQTAQQMQNHQAPNGETSSQAQFAGRFQNTAPITASS